MAYLSGSRSTGAQRRLFVEAGYAATKMTDVAAAAEVSVELVYGAFGTKANLLKTVFEVTIAGDDEPVPLMQRPALLAIRAEPDPARALLWTHNSPQVYDLLVAQRDWSLTRYEQFLADTWIHLLIAPQHPGGT